MSKVVVSQHETGHGSVRSYAIGFILSLALTLAAYLMVTHQLFSGWGLLFGLATLAITQLMVQLLFFLHLGRESKPFWNLQVLIFAAGVVFIIVFGSLWIMKNLNYMMQGHGPANESDKTIIQDEGYQP